jgi:hypothetical protein
MYEPQWLTLRDLPPDLDISFAISVLITAVRVWLAPEATVDENSVPRTTPCCPGIGRTLSTAGLLLAVYTAKPG